jgi:hypothetical protein
LHLLERLAFVPAFLTGSRKYQSVGRRGWRGRFKKATFSWCGAENWVHVTTVRLYVE